MAKKLEAVSLVIEADGQLRTESSDVFSSEFYRFVASVEPSSLQSIARQYSGSYPNPTAPQIAVNKARFAVTKRNQKHHFGFGFKENAFLSEGQLLTHWDFIENIPKEILSDSEKIDHILKRSDVYEVERDETGNRMFCVVRTHTDKSDWNWDFANNRIKVLRAT